jgi:hypothetical protein
MKRIKLYLSIAVFVVFGCSLAQAQASRTWVSGVGDDANPCSRTAPCKTFAGAISKTAAGGEIDVLDPGGFGGLTITKSITIDGGGGQVASTLVNGTNGINVNGAATDSVTLRNLSINGLATSPSGIKFNSGASLHIEHCAVFGFTTGIDIEPSSTARVSILNTSSHDNATGLFATGTGGTVFVSISDSNFASNGTGVSAGDASKVSVRGSDASGNGYGYFVQAASGLAFINVTDSTAANNVTAGLFAGGSAGSSLARVSNVALFNNGAGFATGSNGTILSFGNNHNSGAGTPTSTIAPQ